MVEKPQGSDFNMMRSRVRDRSGRIPRKSKTVAHHSSCMTMTQPPLFTNDHTRFLASLTAAKNVRKGSIGEEDREDSSCRSNFLTTNNDAFFISTSPLVAQKSTGRFG
jgi:hypothetical protein